MDPNNTRMQMLCLWCGPAAMVLFGIGWWGLAGFVPPPSPNDSALEIQQVYVDNTDGIRAGLVLTMFAGTLTGIFAAAICVQMRRVEGRYTPLSYTELGMGMLGVLLFILTTMPMQVAAFRPEDTDPELLRTINDLGFIPFVGIFAPAFAQNIAIALVAFKDTEQRVFPRWLGYYNVWVALLFLPAVLLYFFKTGPFAWDGVFVWWVPLTIFSSWFIVMFVVLRKSIQRQRADGATDAQREERVEVPA
jgi:hypothetical protein